MKAALHTRLPALVIASALAAALAAPLPALAQYGNYRVQSMNFDLWCQEDARLPVERCDRRLPEDVQVFEAHRAKVEQYEIDYLRQKDNAIRLDRNILHADPVDDPLSKSQTQQRQDVTRTPPRN
ncbi:MAG TPA: hypothetical protein VFQ69_04560 [Rhizomicrobium sp.]|nr:hypothetical protein [Rhizomicrobium sp.]